MSQGGGHIEPRARGDRLRGDAAHAEPPAGGDRHGPPPPCRAFRLSHAGPLPRPARALDAFALWFAPGSQAIPSRLAGLGRQIGPEQPRGDIALLPAGQHGAPPLSLPALEGGAGAPPARAGTRHAAGQRAVGGLRVRAQGPSPVEAQQWVPAHPDAAPQQPAGLQPAIGQHDDGPARGTGRPPLTPQP